MSSLSGACHLAAALQNASEAHFCCNAMPPSSRRITPAVRRTAKRAEGTNPSVGVEAVASSDDLLEGPPTGDHGQHVLDVGDHHIQQVGALGGQGLPNRSP